MEVQQQQKRSVLTKFHTGMLYICHFSTVCWPRHLPTRKYIYLSVLYQVGIIWSRETNNSAQTWYFYIKSCLLITIWFLHCAFSCASSTDWTVCMSSCIACRQKVSHRCVKACDTSNCCVDCKRSCTGCMQRAFLQCASACVS